MIAKIESEAYKIYSDQISNILHMIKIPGDVDSLGIGVEHKIRCINTNDSVMLCNSLDLVIGDVSRNVAKRLRV